MPAAWLFTINMEIENLQKKIIELETRLSYQDDTVLALNDVVASQQKQIDVLERQLQLLNKQIKALHPSDIGPAEAETPPPHY